MKLLRSVAMAFSMFSRLPAPILEWQAANMPFVMAALPLVGLAVGLAQWAWAAVSAALGFSAFLYGCGAALVPLAVAGGIHLDGLADTADALASHATPEKKREILKDPQTGAFGVISITAVLLLYAGLAGALSPSWQSALLLGLCAATARVGGGFAVLFLPAAGTGGLSDTFKGAAARGGAALLALLGAGCAALWIGFFGLAGLAAVGAAALCFAYLAHMAKRQFGGMSGDLAGFLIQISDISMLGAALLAQRVEALL